MTPQFSSRSKNTEPGRPASDWHAALAFLSSFWGVATAAVLTLPAVSEVTQVFGFPRQVTAMATLLSAFVLMQTVVSRARFLTRSQSHVRSVQRRSTAWFAIAFALLLFCISSYEGPDHHAIDMMQFQMLAYIIAMPCLTRSVAILGLLEYNSRFKALDVADEPATLST